MEEEFDGMVFYINPIGMIDLEVSSNLKPEKISFEETAFPSLSLKKSITKLAKGFAKEMSEVGNELMPTEVQIELKLALSKEMKAWFINVGGETSVGVKLIWNKNDK